MKTASVLSVDDDRVLTKGLADLLELHGHAVSIAGNGKEAVERCQDQDFDLTFMDVRMPVMNGVDSFFEIRRIRPQARIVMMTGFKEEVVNKALAAGAVGLLNKPFAIDKMLQQLAAI